MRRLFWIPITIATLVVACSAKRRVDEPLPPIDRTRLSHERHEQIPCTGCHRPSDQRPGIDDHKPCDDGACHRKEFLSPPGDLCRVCHEWITVAPLATKLRPYPSEDLWQSLPPVFSHRRHMDAAGMEDKVGFHVACADCHVRDGGRVTPGHAACARCHAAEVALEKAPPMEDCGGCHRAGMRPRKRQRLIRGDLKFSHERHVTDRKNKVIGNTATGNLVADIVGECANKFKDNTFVEASSCVK